MPAIDCGIDIGSTNLKVILVTGDGALLSVRTMPTPRVADEVGTGAGQATDALALVHLLEDLIVESWRDVAQGQPLRSITAVGVGEDGLGVTPDQRPTGLSIPWFDNRAADEAEELAQHFGATARTGIAIGPDRTAAKWLWTHRNRPAELTAASTWIALTDFPAAYWTGRPFMSASLAPRTACFDIVARDWSTELLDATHAPPLPPLLGAGTSLGPVKNGRLPDSGAVDANTVVAVGGHDHPVAASVIRAYDPTAIVDSLGTANLLYGETDALRLSLKSADLAVSVPPGGGSAFALLGVLEFAASLSAAAEDAGQIRAFLAHDVLPGAPPADAATLWDSTLAPDMKLRRSIERECLRARSLAQEMALLGVPPGPIYSTGGWSRSRGFMSLRASVFGQPLKMIDDIELSALGAAQFGAKAATGQLTCLVRTDDIKTVNPIESWVPLYDALARRSVGGAQV